MKKGECSFLPEEHKGWGERKKRAVSPLVKRRVRRLSVVGGDKGVEAEGQRVGSNRRAPAPATATALATGAAWVSNPAEVAQRVAQDLAWVLKLNGTAGPVAEGIVGGRVRVVETSLLD